MKIEIQKGKFGFGKEKVKMNILVFKRDVKQ